MKNLKTNKSNYFKIIFPIVLIIILIVLIIVFNNRNDNESSAILNTSDAEVMVRDSSISDTQSNSSQDSTKSSDNDQLGPATVQDLGGSSGSGNIDELLKGKEIEVEK